jgi:hypothetical protein
MEMHMTRPLKGWWTVAVNTLAASPLALDAAQPLLTAILGLPEFQALIPVGLLPYYALALAAVNIWLRSITDTPIGKAEADA